MTRPRSLDQESRTVVGDACPILFASASGSTTTKHLSLKELSNIVATTAGEKYQLLADKDKLIRKGKQTKHAHA